MGERRREGEKQGEGERKRLGMDGHGMGMFERFLGVEIRGLGFGRWLAAGWLLENELIAQ